MFLFRYKYRVVILHRVCLYMGGCHSRYLQHFTSPFLGFNNCIRPFTPPTLIAMLQNHWRHLTPVFALLILGLVGVGCDSSGLSGLNDPGTEGQATTNQGPGQAGPPGNLPGGPPVNTPGGGDSADVRVAHLSPDAPGVDVYVGLEPGAGDPTIPGLTYPDFFPEGLSGDYVSLAPGTYDIAVTPTGATPEEPPIDADGVELEPNKDYTILAVGELTPEEEGEPEIQALPLVDNGEEDPALPPRDKTLVRFVHASPDAGAVDIGVKNGPTLLEGVEFGDASAYLEIDPGDYKITVGPGALPPVSFTAKAGTKRTAYVIGNASPDEGDEGLSVVTSLEATNPAGTGSFVDRDDDEDEDEEEYEEEDDE